MDPFGAFSFVFRDPEDVFRDFFGGSFNDIFYDTSSSHSRNNGYHHQHHHHRNSHPQSNEYTLSTNFMNPFMGMRMMDDFFRIDGNDFGGHSGHSNGFTSIQTINSSFGGGGSSGAFKRTSQSTSIVNGKKITTKV